MQRNHFVVIKSATYSQLLIVYLIWKGTVTWAPCWLWGRTFNPLFSTTCLVQICRSLFLWLTLSPSSALWSRASYWAKSLEASVSVKNGCAAHRPTSHAMSDTDTHKKQIHAKMLEAFGWTIKIQEHVHNYSEIYIRHVLLAVNSLPCISPLLILFVFSCVLRSLF